MQIQYLSLLLSGTPYNPWYTTNIHVLSNRESLACLLVLEHMTIHTSCESKKNFVTIQYSVQIQYTLEFETLRNGNTHCIRNTIFVRKQLVPIQYLCLALFWRSKLFLNCLNGQGFALYQLVFSSIQLYEIYFVADNSTSYNIGPTPLRTHPLYSSLSMLASTLLLNMAPCTALYYLKTRWYIGHTG